MKKILIFIILCTFSLPALCDKGVVLVHETPLFREKNYESKIVQYVRQGTIIYIHKRHIDNLKANSEIEENLYRGNNNKQLVLNNKFYETMDKNAGKAYIPAQFVKLITGDDNELKQPISNYRNDPTDYRYPEPLPDNYPLYDPKKFRSGLNFSIGYPEDISYDYPSEIIYKDLGYSAGLSFFYVKNLIENPKNRFFLGGEIRLRRSISQFQLKNSQINSTEEKTIYSVGPKFIYDIFKRDGYIISLNTSVLLNFHDYFLLQDKNKSNGVLVYKDTANYRGFSFGLVPGLTLQKAIFKKIYLTLGSNIMINSPYSLTNHKEHDYDEFWNKEGKDTFNTSATYNLNFHFGVQGTY